MNNAEKARQWRKNNPEKKKQHNREYAKRFPHKFREKSARRRAAQLDATFPCCSETQNEINKFYENCPDGMEVDHIRPPSQGGLHHPINLQYLTPEENRKKGTKFRPEDQIQICNRFFTK